MNAAATGCSSVTSEIVAALGLPKWTRSVHIYVSYDSAVMIDCEYFPSGEELEKMAAVLRGKKLALREVKPIRKLFTLHEQSSVPEENPTGRRAP